MYENPDQLLASRTKKVDTFAETKQHVMGHVGVGQILGMEEAVLGKTDQYSQTAICISSKVELFRIERDYFITPLKQT